MVNVKIFTIKNIEKHFYVYKNEIKHPRGYADQGLVCFYCTCGEDNF